MKDKKMQEQNTVYAVSEDGEGIRIDQYLSKKEENASRSGIQKRIREGAIRVNDAVVKPNYRLTTGDVISVDSVVAAETTIVPQDIPLVILYEDEDILVVDKPKGMVVHPAPGHYDGTLVNAIMYHCKDSLSGINGEIRPGIVHRIDQNTTGSLIVCKNDTAHIHIAKQIKEHTINRIYRGIVVGRVSEDEGTIRGAIGRNPKDRKKMAINEKNGKEAITHYKVIKRYKNHTYMEFKLETGRTHQIRVHMASIGHPLLGDDVYGAKKCPYNLQGQTLHAAVIGFEHPTSGVYMEVEAPLPEYFTHLLKVLD